MFKSAVIAVVLAVAFAAPPMSPNVKACNPPTTDFQWKQCLANPIIDTYDLTLSPYPADPHIPIELKFTYNINNGQSYDKLLVDVSLSYFGSILGSCGFHWIPIPLNNLDGCSVVNNCPLIPGAPQQNDVTVDLSPFASIIDTLAGNTYYELKVTIKDANKNPLTCIQADFLLK